MLLLYPMKIAALSVAIAWLLRRCGLVTSIPRAAVRIAVLLIGIAVAPALASVIGAFWPAILGLGALGIASYRMFAGQRDKLFGHRVPDASPKRRQGGAP